MNLGNIKNFFINCFEYYKKSKKLRNFTAFIIDCSYLYLVYWNIYYVVMTPLKNMNCWIIGLSLPIIAALRELSIKLRVTRICPKCLENRGIKSKTYETGNKKNPKEYVDGDYWMHSEEHECLKEIRCNYCSYAKNEVFWTTKTWKGDLTEDAKIRRAAKAHEEAERRARVRAYEEIKKYRR